MAFFGCRLSSPDLDCVCKPWYSMRAKKLFSVPQMPYLPPSRRFQIPPDSLIVGRRIKTPCRKTRLNKSTFLVITKIQIQLANLPVKLRYEVNGICQKDRPGRNSRLFAASLISGQREIFPPAPTCLLDISAFLEFA